MVRTRVGVLGGGIIGVTSAIVAMETVPAVDVTLLSEKFTPDTTADGAAGFWNPYLVGDVSDETLRFWCKETFDFLLNLTLSPEAGKFGVGLLSGYILSEEPVDVPAIADIFLEFRPLEEKELKVFPAQYKYGSFVTTVYAECSKLLPHLMERFCSRGGKVVKRRVNDLRELAGEFDVVINCPGVHAAHLVPDPAVQPIRGQVFRVKAPWIKHAVIAGTDYHVLPNTDTVVCGGTKQYGNWSTAINPEDSRRIWEGCCRIVPSLKNAEIIRQWVGLRPGRSAPRIERDVLVTEDGVHLELIHNYGHGGSGITLFWGCAKDAVNLLKEVVSEIRQPQAKL